MAGLLKPGGAFLFDVYSLAYFETWEERVAYGRGLMDGFWSASEYFGFLNTFRYEAEKVVLEKYVIVEADRITRVLQLVPALRSGTPERRARSSRTWPSTRCSGTSPAQPTTPMRRSSRSSPEARRTRWRSPRDERTGSAARSKSAGRAS